MVELLYYENPIPDDNFKRVNFVGCTHFAVTVDDIDELYGDLITKGVHFIKEPISNGKVKVCKDLNDVYIELVEELQLGIIQGRLSEPTEVSRLSKLEREFDLIRELRLNHIEWIVTENYHSNPIHQVDLKNLYIICLC